MSFAHLTLPTREVEKTAALLERALGYKRAPVPANSPIEAVWLEVAPGQLIHVFHADGFRASPFEGEFGRHFAFFAPLAEFDGMKRRLEAAGAEVFPPERPTPFQRFFFREPVNGYVFEIVEREAGGRE